MVSKDVKPIPDGYRPISPYLIVDDASAAIAFYAKAFSAEEKIRVPTADGKGVMHAEIRIGGDVVMLGEANPDWNLKSPKTLGGSPASIFLYVEDVDTVFATAVTAGAAEIMPPADMFWGDRMGQVVDPFGHKWAIATHVADPTPEEMEAGRKAMCS